MMSLCNSLFYQIHKHLKVTFHTLLPKLRKPKTKDKFISSKYYPAKVQAENVLFVPPEDIYELQNVF